MLKSIAGKIIGSGALVTVLTIFLSALLSPFTVPIAKTIESAVKCRVELDRNVLQADTDQKVVVKVSLEAIKPSRKGERPPANLAIVLDRSGSMAGSKLEKAKEGAIQALRRLGSNDKFSLVVYDHNVDLVVPAQNASNLQWIERKIRRIQSGGYTALFGGVSAGAAELRKNLSKEYVHRIILLSDGIANVGPSSPSDLKRLGVALRKEGISVSTIGVGNDYNEDLMTGLSQKSDGNSYFVETAEDLPRIFAAELGDVLNVVGKDVNLVIKFPKDVKPLRIIGREGRIVNGQAEITLNQLYGGQEKYALLEVEVPRQKAGKEMLIADARVSFENALSQSRETSSGQVSATFSALHKEVEKSANVEVIREIELTNTAISKDRAVSFADKGKLNEAVDELRQSAIRLKEKAKKYNDQAMLNEAKNTEAQAGEIRRGWGGDGKARWGRSMMPQTRKTLRTESYQQKNQQIAK